MSNPRQRRHRVHRGFDLLEGFYSKAKVRQESNVFITILHAIRSKIDKKELASIELSAGTQKISMGASILAEVIGNLQRKRLTYSFGKLEIQSHLNKLRKESMVSLDQMFIKRKQFAYRVLKANIEGVPAEKASYCEGAVVLLKFFYRKSFQEKSNFFHSGKDLFEELKKNAPSSAKKARMVKSPSLVLEISQNFKIGYQVLGMIARKKIADSFRYSIVTQRYQNFV